MKKIFTILIKGFEAILLPYNFLENTRRLEQAEIIQTSIEVKF